MQESLRNVRPCSARVKYPRVQIRPCSTSFFSRVSVGFRMDIELEYTVRELLLLPEPGCRQDVEASDEEHTRRGPCTLFKCDFPRELGQCLPKFLFSTTCPTRVPLRSMFAPCSFAACVWFATCSAVVGCTASCRSAVLPDMTRRPAGHEDPEIVLQVAGPSSPLLPNPPVSIGIG